MRRDPAWCFLTLALSLRAGRAAEWLVFGVLAAAVRDLGAVWNVL
jgi:hypothetical protein